MSLSGQQPISKSYSPLSRLFLLWSSDYAKVTLGLFKLCNQQKITKENIQQVEEDQSFTQTYAKWGSYWVESAQLSPESDPSGQRLKWTMRKTFQKQIIIAAIMSFIAHQSVALTPLIIYKISQYINADQFAMKQSIILLVTIFTLKISKVFLTMHSTYNLEKVGSKIFCCLCYALTEKCLKKIKFSKGELTISEKSKLAQYDCSKLVEYPLILTEAVFQLYSQIFMIVCLYFVGGWQALVACIVQMTLNMVRFMMVTVFKKYQKNVNVEASERIKKETEVINNMKFIKSNALEGLFFNKLNDLRRFEVNFLKKYLNLGIFATVIQFAASRLCIALFIFLFIITGHDVSAALIFSLMLFFQSMGFHKLMNKINNVDDIGISLIKIEDFLVNEEKDSSYITRSYATEGQNAVVIKNGGFYWEKVEFSDEIIEDMGFSLFNINTTIKKGEFVALIGGYGSGKSSILNAILGEMNNESSKVTINGTIAYASQMPWILNDSVKNNILFGEPYDLKRYSRALQFSRLQTDLSLFANGEDTIIGQKGSTLSGGQRARLSLARALYKQADIYILDDILSALDAHVSSFIFQETLAKHLRGKTIILATHLINYLSLANRVFVIGDGQIKEVVEKHQIMPQMLNMKRKSSINRRVSLEGALEAVDNKKVQKIENIQQNIVPLQQKEELSQSQLLGLLIRRRGGSCYAITNILFMILMIATNLLIIMSLNDWMRSPDNKEPYHFYLYLGILAACIISIGLHAFFEFNSNFFNEIHRMMIRNLFTAPMSYFETTSISNSMNKLSHDIKKVDNQVVNQFRNTVFFLCLGASFIGNSLIMYIRRGQILMIFLIVVSIILIIYYYYYFMVAIRQLHKLEQESQIPIYSCFVEILFGASTIRAYNKEVFMKEKQKDIIEKYIMTTKIMSGVDSYFTFVISLITTFITTVLFIKILVLKDESKVDFFLIYNIFSFERTVENLHTVLAEFLSNLKYIGHCEQLMNIPREQGYDLVQRRGQLQFRDRVSSSDWVKEGKIQFQDFSVKYRPELETVLKNINLTIRPKEKIGVVGRTGSGKSTTILCLLRILQAHQGNLKIDNVDIYSLDIQTLRVGFSIILQEHFLFSGTVRENIDPLKEFEDRKIIRALELCGLWDSMKTRSGLDTVVEESGNNFSAGEKQLINISRTLLNPKKIVLVDEATASIDYTSDELLQRVIKDQLSNSTMFTIAHRIDTILHSDRIMVLDKGKIIELDSPSNLLKNPSSVFRNLYKESQNRQSEQMF